MRLSGPTQMLLIILGQSMPFQIPRFFHKTRQVIIRLPPRRKSPHKETSTLFLLKILSVLLQIHLAVRFTKIYERLSKTLKDVLHGDTLQDNVGLRISPITALRLCWG